MAAKDAGNQAVVRKLGADRAMRNFRTKKPIPLGLGFDVASDGKSVSMNHRPSGLWVLADRGRYNSGPIYPRVNDRRGRKAVYRRALKTPGGFSSVLHYGPSRGTGVFQLAAARERDEAPKAAAQELFGLIGRSVR
jgi:hypothetical protein